MKICRSTDAYYGTFDVRYWHKADMAIALSDVRFRGQSGHRLDDAQCPLLTQNGHERLEVAALQTGLFALFR
jgi:hypothetical protein